MHPNSAETSSMTFTGKDFKQQFYSPLVYIWKRGEEWLYVGKCYYGFHRVINNKHHSTFKDKNIEDADSIEIHYFDSFKTCLRAEKALMDKYRPKYNVKQGPKLPGERYKDEILADSIPEYRPIAQDRKHDRIMKEVFGPEWRKK